MPFGYLVDPNSSLRFSTRCIEKSFQNLIQDMTNILAYKLMQNSHLFDAKQFVWTSRMMEAKLPTKLGCQPMMWQTVE